MLGLTDRQVAFIFLILALISIGLNLMIESVSSSWSYSHAMVFAGYFLALLSFFFFTTRTKKPEVKIN